MKRLILVVALLLVATPAFAWRTGFALRAGVMDGSPSTMVGLDFNEKGSKIHVQPRVQVRKDEGAPGEWEFGMDALVHAAQCHSISPYIGAGVGVEWVTLEGETPAPSCPGPHKAPTPPPVDPPQPTAVLIGGMRWPCTMVDLFCEGRWSFAETNRAGAYLGVVLHEARAHGGKHK